jgi:hypothetical protein
MPLKLSGIFVLGFDIELAVSNINNSVHLHQMFIA